MPIKTELVKPASLYSLFKNEIKQLQFYRVTFRVYNKRNFQSILNPNE